MQIKIGASHVIHLFIPVSVCMALVIASMYSIGFYTRDDGVYLWVFILIFTILKCPNVC